MGRRRLRCWAHQNYFAFDIGGVDMCGVVSMAAGGASPHIETRNGARGAPPAPHPQRGRPVASSRAPLLRRRSRTRAPCAFDPVLTRAPCAPDTPPRLRWRRPCGPSWRTRHLHWVCAGGLQTGSSRRCGPCVQLHPRLRGGQPSGRRGGPPRPQAGGATPGAGSTSRTRASVSW